ncbi:MAG: pyridoxamine 5'-phosphate oxidase family protein [Paracoccaceae bacterium]
MAKRDPINPTDDEARALGRSLLRDARYGALATVGQPTPLVTRVATVALDGAPLILVSTLSAHTQALAVDPNCSVLLGEPQGKGDPLTHPRMTVCAVAQEADKATLKDHWLAAIPKATLYYDFTDFRLFRLAPTEIHLNGGFGKAYRLAPEDLI